MPLHGKPLRRCALMRALWCMPHWCMPHACTGACAGRATAHRATSIFAVACGLLHRKPAAYAPHTRLQRTSLRLSSAAAGGTSDAAQRCDGCAVGRRSHKVVLWEYHTKKTTVIDTAMKDLTFMKCAAVPRVLGVLGVRGVRREYPASPPLVPW